MDLFETALGDVEYRCDFQMAHGDLKSRAREDCGEGCVVVKFWGISFLFFLSWYHFCRLLTLLIVGCMLSTYNNNVILHAEALAVHTACPK